MHLLPIYALKNLFNHPYDLLALKDIPMINIIKLVKSIPRANIEEISTGLKSHMYKLL